MSSFKGVGVGGEGFYLGGAWEWVLGLLFFFGFGWGFFGFLGGESRARFFWLRFF
jgi:hypothetical protein